MYSQKTTPYELPQWLGSDKANWDVDLNAAFLIINDLFVNMQDYLSKLQNKVDGDVISDIEKVNNQITDIISRLDENDEQVVAIKEKVNSIGEMVDKLQTDYENLNTTVENNEEAVGVKIASIEDEIENVKGDITTLTANYNVIKYGKELRKVKPETLHFSYNSDNGFYITLNFGDILPELESGNIGHMDFYFAVPSESPSTGGIANTVGSIYAGVGDVRVSGSPKATRSSASIEIRQATTNMLIIHVVGDFEATTEIPIVEIKFKTISVFSLVDGASFLSTIDAYRIVDTPVDVNVNIYNANIYVSKSKGANQ